MFKLLILATMIFFTVIFLAIIFWLTLFQYPRMASLNKLCQEGVSVEICPNGDYLVGRENMQKDDDRYSVYDKNGNFLYSEGGKGVKKIESLLYLYRQKTNPEINQSCLEQLLSSYKPIPSACQ